MDVVCEHCSTEYEFDDALVSERGTTVKCTNCGHQFKIFRPTAEGDSPRVWNLRRPDGTVIPFDSLAVLQKWILEGKVSKMDEISRAGEPWKALGAIAELESFFVTAESRASQNAGPRSGRPTGSHSARPTTNAPVVAARSEPSKPAVPVLGGGTIRPAGGAPPPPPPSALRGPSGGTPPPLPPAALRGSTRPRSLGSSNNAGVEIPKAPKLPEDIAHAEAPNGRARATSDRPPPPLSSKPPPALPKVELPPLPPVSERPLADDEAPTRALPPERVGVTSLAPPPEPRSSLVPGLLLGVALAGVGTVVAWQMGAFNSGATTPATPPPTTRVDPSASASLIERAAAEAKAFTPQSLEESRDLLTRALGASPDDAAVLAERAEVLASWSEMLRQRADDLELRARAGGADAAALNAEAAMLRRDAERRAERARGDLAAAESHLDAVPSARRGEVEAKLADVARIVGTADAAQRHREAAQQSSERSPAADLALSLAATQDDPSASVAALRQVLARDESSVRARLALARALSRAGDSAGARSEAEALLQRSPNHEAAMALLAVIPPGAADAGTTVAQAPTPSPPAPTPAPTSAPSTATARHAPSNNGGDEPLPAAGGDYDHLVAEADRLQHGGRTALARERYLRALGVRPTGAEALTGMGNVEIDQGNLSAAVSRFRAALASNPRYSDAYIGLGEAYAHQRNYRQAIEAFERYLQVNPSGSRAYMARSQITALQERMRQQEPQGEAPSSSSGTSESQGTAGAQPSGP